MWTFDTKVEVTPAAISALQQAAERKAQRGYKPTASGRRVVRPLQQARDVFNYAAQNNGIEQPFRWISVVDTMFSEEAAKAIFCEDCPAPAVTKYFGRNLCQECIDHYERQDARAAEQCPTCNGHGVIPIAAAGNQEIKTNCPDCRPDIDAR